MIDYEKVSKSLAYLIETMNGFNDSVLTYKYSKVLVHYKNYIEKCALGVAFNSVTRLYDRVQSITGTRHNNYLYFPHLEEEVELVDVETVSQLQMDLLVRAGMPITTEPVTSEEVTDDGPKKTKVTFKVTLEIAEKYQELLTYSIKEYKIIISHEIEVSRKKLKENGEEEIFISNDIW